VHGGIFICDDDFTLKHGLILSFWIYDCKTMGQTSFALKRFKMEYNGVE